MTAINAIKQ